MTGAQQRLKDFLSLPRKPELVARAHFYVGQIDYFQGKVRDALLEFLGAQDFFYQESEPWIDACYAWLERSDL
jgi:TolA-binding protein